MIDDVDWNIIARLQLDGRKTFKELGEAISFTSLGAKKRVQKVLEQKVIHPSALVYKSGSLVQQYINVKVEYF